MTVLAGNIVETDYAYLAGIIDGEGTVSINRTGAKKKGRIPRMVSAASYNF